MRLGIFGGSFDPIHYGHLLLAECCREQASLDEVWFVPAGSPPHKRGRALSAANSRIEMLQLAIGGHAAFRISTIETERSGISYTVDTLQAINASHPAAELFFLMGADSLADLPNWRDPVHVCELATPLVVRRVGAPEPDFGLLTTLLSTERIAHIAEYQVQMPRLELSSTDLRDRARTGRSLRYRTPAAVEQWIASHRLYVE